MEKKLGYIDISIKWVILPIKTYLRYIISLIKLDQNDLGFPVMADLYAREICPEITLNQFISEKWK